MSRRPPDSMLGYMTAELEEAIRPLSQRQIRFISDLIAAGYFAEEPLAPYAFLFGSTSPNAEYDRWPGKMGRNAWADVPKFDEDGKLIKSPGWSHQPAFVHALTLAKKLARRRHSRALIEQIERTYNLAAAAGPDVMGKLIEIATDTAIGADGAPMARGTRDNDTINAAAKILPILAQLRQEAGDEEERDDEAADWWAVMDEDE